MFKNKFNNYKENIKQNKNQQIDTYLENAEKQFNLGNRKESSKFLDKVLMLDRYNLTANFNITVLEYLDNNLESAEQFIDKIYSVDINRPEIALLKIKISAAQGKTTECRSIIDQLGGTNQDVYPNTGSQNMPTNIFIDKLVNFKFLGNNEQIITEFLDTIIAHDYTIEKRYNVLARAIYPRSNNYLLALHLTKQMLTNSLIIKLSHQEHPGDDFAENVWSTNYHLASLYRKINNDHKAAAIYYNLYKKSTLHTAELIWMIDHYLFEEKKFDLVIELAKKATKNKKLKNEKVFFINRIAEAYLCEFNKTANKYKLRKSLKHYQESLRYKEEDDKINTENIINQLKNDLSRFL